MFKRTKKTDVPEPSRGNAPSVTSRKIVPSVISADMHILGNIISDGFIDIDGRIDGNVRCASATVRERGKIKGDLTAETIQIYGEVEGIIKAKTVTLRTTARVSGMIIHESLSIEDGATVDGKFKRTDHVFIEDDTVAKFEAMLSGDSGSGMLDNLRLISG